MYPISWELSLILCMLLISSILFKSSLLHGCVPSFFIGTLLGFYFFILDKGLQITFGGLGFFSLREPALAVLGTLPFQGYSVFELFQLHI